MKSDVIQWPRDEAGNWTEEKFAVEPVPTPMMPPIGTYSIAPAAVLATVGVTCTAR